jgi:hypothetical protein
MKDISGPGDRLPKVLSGSADDGGDDGDDDMQRGSARPVHSRDSRDSLPPRKKKESIACAHL